MKSWILSLALCLTVATNAVQTSPLRQDDSDDPITVIKAALDLIVESTQVAKQYIEDSKSALLSRNDDIVREALLAYLDLEHKRISFLGDTLLGNIQGSDIIDQWSELDTDTGDGFDAIAKMALAFQVALFASVLEEVGLKVIDHNRTLIERVASVVELDAPSVGSAGLASDIGEKFAAVGNRGQRLARLVQRYEEQGHLPPEGVDLQSQLNMFDEVKREASLLGDIIAMVQGMALSEQPPEVLVRLDALGDALASNEQEMVRLLGYAVSGTPFF